MIDAGRCVLILLAAGRSERFGDADKLQQDFLGAPLARHVVTALEGVPFQARIAVRSHTGQRFDEFGYCEIVNANPSKGLSSSVKLGLAAARMLVPDAVLIALADMPRVTATHVYNLLEAGNGTDAVVASSDGEEPMPPVLFGAGHFDALMQLEGDQGARDMVRAGRHVIAAASELVDIDTPEDLVALRDMVGAAIRGGARRSD